MNKNDKVKDLKFNCNIKKCPLDIIELDISQFLKEDEVIDNIIFEKNIKKLIVLTNLGVKIFNRCGTILKRQILFQYPNKFEFAALNKELTYLLLATNLKLERQILGINIKESSIKGCLKGKMQNLMGIFFISKFVFCIVSLYKINYLIIHDCSEEFQTLNSTIEFPKNNPIKNYFYNRQCNILIVERNDNSFNLINLTDESYYSKIIKNFNINFNKFSSFIDNFSFLGNIFKKKLHESAKREIRDKIFIDSGNPNETYSKNQYFLKFIYSHLYFLYLSIESNSLYILRMENLEKFPSLSDPFNLNIQINFNLDNNSTLQVINNLIIVYNFTKKKIDIIDLKFKNENTNSKTICRCLDESVFPYFSHKGKQFYFKDGIIEEVDKNRNKIIYTVNFNLEKYYNSFNSEIQSFLLSDFLRRNNSEQFILKKLETIILNETYNIEKMNWIFQQFVNNLKKCIDMAQKIIDEKMDGEKKIIRFDPYKTIYVPFQFKLLKYKNSIRQQKYFTVFDNIIDNYNLEDKDVLRILFYFLDFWNIIINNTMENGDYIQSIFYKYIKKLPERAIRQIFLNNIKYPINKELGIFLINPNLNKKDKLLSQIGYSILYNKEYDNNEYDILEQLKKDNFPLCLLYAKKNFDGIGINSIKESIVNILKEGKLDIKIKKKILKIVKGL